MLILTYIKKLGLTTATLVKLYLPPLDKIRPSLVMNQKYFLLSM